MYPVGQSGIPGQGMNQSGPSAPAAPGAANEKPKKFVKINGVMQKNPAYEQYLQNQGKVQDSGLTQQPAALNIISNMDEHAAFNEVSQQTGARPRPLAPSMDATIEMMQEPEIAGAIGLDADEMVDGLGNIFAKYEVPMGLMNKLMILGDFNSLQFIVDNSGSMGQNSDTKLPNGQPQTRWQEAESRLISMMEVLAYVPCAPVEVRFLNGNDKVHIRHEPNQTPAAFLQDATNKIHQAFRKRPYNTTPALEKLKQSIQEGQGQNIARYFFGDGVPNGGDFAIKQIENLIKNRPNPSQNPMTFLSCTGEDQDVEWMKELEEVAPFCAEYDDYDDEKNEVLRDQGQAFPFSRGFHLIGQLVAAMNPEDLDAMDESVPFTKATLDNLLGIVHTPEEYQHYFQHFVDAQSSRTGESPLDSIKKNTNWHQHFHAFSQAPMARDIPAVQQFKAELARASGNPMPAQQPQQNFGQPGGYGQQGFGNTPQYSTGYQGMNAQPAANNGQFSQGVNQYGAPPQGYPQVNQNGQSMTGNRNQQTGGLKGFFNRHF